MLSWLWDNIGSLVLALVLAVTVWVAAVSAEDPIEVREYTTPIPIEQVGLKPGLIIVTQPADQATVQIRAPRSILSQLRSNEINLWIDMQDLDVGTHTIPVQSRVDRPAVQINAIDPSSQIVTLESAASTQVPIVALASGEPAVGFRASPPDVDPETAVVTGPASAVTRTDRIIAEIDLNGRRQDFSQEVTLIPVDEDGIEIDGVLVNPEIADVGVSIEALGGYRSVVVNPRIVDEVESGYQPTKITVSPTFVTVFSGDPETISELGGFVETEIISLSGVTENIEQRVNLDLPDGVIVVGDTTVVVTVTIKPIESFVTLTKELQFEGLPPELFALPSPKSVSLIINGPLPVLDALLPEDVLVVLNLEGLDEGIHQIVLTPDNVLLPISLNVQTILPETIEVIITTEAPPTPIPTPTVES